MCSFPDEAIGVQHPVQGNNWQTPEIRKSHIRVVWQVQEGVLLFYVTVKSMH